VRITNPNKNVWTLKYDDAGNLISVTDPQGGTASATRSAAGQITAPDRPEGQQEQLSVQRRRAADGFHGRHGHKWAFDYDAAARAATRTDPSGATLKAEYTARNRISALTAGNTRPRSTIQASNAMHWAA